MDTETENEAAHDAQTKTTEVKFDAATLAAALTVAAKKDVRHYLNGVHFQNVPEGVRVQSTNGHTAFTRILPYSAVGDDARHTAALQVGVILHRDGLERVLKMFKSAKDSDIRLRFQPFGLEVRAANWSNEIILSVAVIGGTFPDLPRVIRHAWADRDVPTPPSAGHTPGLAAEYVAQVGKVAGLLGAMVVHPMVPKGDACTMFTFGGGTGSAGSLMIVMPMRGERGTIDDVVGSMLGIVKDVPADEQSAEPAEAAA